MDAGADTTADGNPRPEAADHDTGVGDSAESGVPSTDLRDSDGRAAAAALSAPTVRSLRCRCTGVSPAEGGAATWPPLPYRTLRLFFPTLFPPPRRNGLDVQVAPRSVILLTWSGPLRPVTL